MGVLRAPKEKEAGFVSEKSSLAVTRLYLRLNLINQCETE